MVELFQVFLSSIKRKVERIFEIKYGKEIVSLKKTFFNFNILNKSLTFKTSDHIYHTTIIVNNQGSIEYFFFGGGGVAFSFILLINISTEKGVLPPDHKNRPCNTEEKREDLFYIILPSIEEF